METLVTLGKKTRKKRKRKKKRSATTVKVLAALQRRGATLRPGSSLTGRDRMPGKMAPAPAACSDILNYN